MKIIKINDDTFSLTEGESPNAYPIPEGFASLEETPVKMVGDALQLDEESINSNKLNKLRQKKSEEVENHQFSATIDGSETPLTQESKNDLAENLLLAIASKDDAAIQLAKDSLLKFKEKKAASEQLKSETISKIFKSNEKNINTISLPSITDEIDKGLGTKKSSRAKKNGK